MVSVCSSPVSVAVGNPATRPPPQDGNADGKETRGNTCLLDCGREQRCQDHSCHRHCRHRPWRIRHEQHQHALGQYRSRRPGASVPARDGHAKGQRDIALPACGPARCNREGLTLPSRHLNPDIRYRQGAGRGTHQTLRRVKGIPFPCPAPRPRCPQLNWPECSRPRFSSRAIAAPSLSRASVLRLRLIEVNFHG